MGNYSAQIFSEGALVSFLQSRKHGLGVIWIFTTRLNRQLPSSLSVPILCFITISDLSSVLIMKSVHFGREAQESSVSKGGQSALTVDTPTASSLKGGNGVSPVEVTICYGGDFGSATFGGGLRRAHLDTAPAGSSAPTRGTVPKCGAPEEGSPERQLWAEGSAHGTGAPEGRGMQGSFAPPGLPCRCAGCPHSSRCGLPSHAAPRLPKREPLSILGGSAGMRRLRPFCAFCKR